MQLVVDQNEVEIRLVQGLTSLNSQGAWRNLRPAFLGTGENPPRVIVPPAEAIQPGMFYAYEQIDGAKSPPFQVLNLYAGLSYDNATADLPIMVGFPPKSNTLSIQGVNPANGLTFTGGALPAQVAQNNSLYVTPERFATHRLQANDNLILSYTGGWLRFGAEILAYVPQIEEFVDLTSYIPTDPDTACYVSIGIDQSQTAIVVSGATFAVDAAEPVTYVPTTLQAGVALLGAVFLTDTTTAISQDKIVIIPDIYYVPEAIPTIPDTLGVTVSDTEPLEPAAGQWWLDSSDTLDALYIRNSGNANWNSLINLGNPDRAFSGLYGGQVGYVGVYSPVDIAGGVINLGGYVAAIVVPVGAETGTADDLDTITTGSSAYFIFALQADTGDTITVKHGTGNIFFNDATDHSITGDQTILILSYGGKCFAWY